MPRLTEYQQKALDFSKHISLTANAGSGKTFVLSKRYVEIALQENIPLKKIVAITFTKKAAAELKKKIAKEFDSRINEEQNPDLLDRLEKLRNQLASSNISTIHSFCGDILKEFAPEAGIDVAFKQVETAEVKELLELSIEEFLTKHIDNTEISPIVKNLLRFAGNKTKLNSLIDILVSKRKTVKKLFDDVYSMSDEDVHGYLKNISDEKYSQIIAPLIDDAINKIRKINYTVFERDPKNTDVLEINAVFMKEPYDTFESKISFLGKISSLLLTKQGTVKKQGYLNKNDQYELEAEIESVNKFFKQMKAFLEADFSDPVIGQLTRFGKEWLLVFNGILDLYERRKRINRYLDFEDVLILTRKVLKRDEVIEYLAEKFNYIMVDEYQDTNEIQYEIFMPILKNLAANNLFVVGDEKQSIYMFREADLEVFERTRSEIKSKSDSGILQLPHSFRLKPGIALFTNFLFSRLFKDADPEFNEVEYTDILCAHPDKTGGEVGFLFSGDEGPPEAENTAGKIIQLVSEGKINFGDAAILCRKREAFAELQKVFAEKKIPNKITGGKGFFQQQIVYDINNYLLFLANQNNDAALLGVLRSPFYTISDTRIFEISRFSGDSFFDKLIGYGEADKNILPVINLLKKHIEYGKVESAGKLLRKILLETGYRAVIAGKPDAEQQLSNLDKLISFAYEYELQGFKTLYDFTDYLANATKLFEDEGQAETSSEDDSVKIMTIHQSKGLEYKCVFLFGCGDIGKDSGLKSGEIAVDKKLGILAKLPRENNYFEKPVIPASAALYNFIENKKQEAEQKRLLYVAVTRASDYLFISAKTPGKNGNFGRNSFMEFISSVFPDIQDKNFISIKTPLEYMKGEDDNYEKYIKDTGLNITIEKEVAANEVKKTETTELPDLKFFTDTIEDKSKNEIYSASKIALFNQCPLKYRLTYELNYTKLFQRFKTFENNFEFHLKEDEETAHFADLKGKIIHSILEDEIVPGKLYEAVNEKLKTETEFRNEIDEEKFILLEKEISGILEKFVSSEEFSEIKSFSNFKNEFEVYAGINDYFLYGIIDKLAVTEEKLYIIDFKTDKITKETVSRKTEFYLPQLKFYALIAAGLYPEREIELRLVFVREPDLTFKKIIDKKELIGFSGEVTRVIEEIRSGNFSPDTEHCKVCHFADTNNNCIKEL